MKSIILSAAFSVLTFGVGLAMIYFILFDHVNSQTRSLLKRGLQETILQVSALPIESRRTQVLRIFADFIRPDLLDGYRTTVDLMDMSVDPLAIRIRMNVVATNYLFPISVSSDETIVEVEP